MPIIDLTDAEHAAVTAARSGASSTKTGSPTPRLRPVALRPRKARRRAKANPRPDVVTISISAEALAVRATVGLAALGQRRRDRGDSVTLPRAMLNRACAAPGESYSGVILRLATAD
jgi:hypothetical protein